MLREMARELRLYTTGDCTLQNEGEIIGATKRWLIEVLDRGTPTQENQGIAKHLLGEPAKSDSQVERMKVYVQELEQLSDSQEKLYMAALRSEGMNIAAVAHLFALIDERMEDLIGVCRTLSHNPIEAKGSLEQWFGRTVTTLSEAGLPQIADSLRVYPLTQSEERFEILRSGRHWYSLLESWRNSVRRDPEHYIVRKDRDAPVEKVRLLFFGANPSDQPQLLDQSEEVRAIRNGIRGSKHREEVEFDPVLAVRFTDVTSELRQEAATIVHFSAHGEPDLITLKNESGQSESLYSEEIVKLFKEVPGKIQLVVLSSCRSEKIAKELAKFIPCTIGMILDIYEKSATVFSSELYKALCDGLSIANAFQQARRALRGESEIDVAAPVMYHRDDCNPENMFLVMGSGKAYPKKKIEVRNSEQERMTAKSSELSRREINTWGVCAAFVFIGVNLIFNLVYPNPTATQHEAFKTVASLAAGTFGLLVPGLLIVNVKGSLPWPMTGGKFAISGTSGAAFFLITYFFTPATPVLEGPKLRVTVLSASGMPVTKPEVWSSLGTVSRDNDGRCLIAIPMMPDLKGTAVTVYAKDPETFCTGQQEIELSGKAIEDLRVQLKKVQEEKIIGVVRDSSGHTVAGASVYVVGHSNEAVSTGSQGEFTIAAHAASAESIRICVSKKGYESAEAEVQVDPERPVALIMDRR